MRITILNIFILFCIIFTSCDTKNSCFHSYGDEKMIRIEMENFNELVIDGGYIINLINSTENTIEVIGGENNIEFFSYEIKNNILTLKNKNQCNWLRDYDNKVKINVYFNDMRVITNKSESYISNTKPLQLDTFFIHQTGVGDINLNIKSSPFIMADLYINGDLELTGTVKEFHCDVASYGNLKAENLKADTLYIETSHEGSAFVYPTKFIKAVCSKIGNIYYYNEAEKLIIEETNKGRYLKGK